VIRHGNVESTEIYGTSTLYCGDNGISQRKVYGWMKRLKEVGKNGVDNMRFGSK
jgi:hypothetical protein